MSQNDRSFLQTALDLANKARAALRIAKAAMVAGLKGAAVAVVQETLPFLVKLIIGFIIATVILPMFVFTAMPNMFFGFENANAEEQITMREQALSIGGAYMSLETFEQTYRDSVVTSILSGYQNEESEIDTSGFTNPGTKNNLDLAAYAIQAWENGWGYVWGSALCSLTICVEIRSKTRQFS